MLSCDYTPRGFPAGTWLQSSVFDEPVDKCDLEEYLRIFQGRSKPLVRLIVCPSPEAAGDRR